MAESYLGSIAIVDSCLGIIVLELIKLLFVKGRTYTLALPKGFPVKCCLIGYRHCLKWLQISIFKFRDLMKMNIIGQSKVSFGSCRIGSINFWKVMHIEKNFNENIINAVMDVPEKTKDDIKGRMDMSILCSRQELNLTTRGSTDRLCKPKAKFALLLPQKRAVCQWLRDIHVPDGYSSNVGNWVDLSNTKL